VSFGKRGVVTAPGTGGREQVLSSGRVAAPANRALLHGHTAAEFTATYNLKFSWFGVLGFWFAGKNFYDNILYPPQSAFTLEQSMISVWFAILIGLLVGGFSLWHGLRGSPALVIDKDGVTGYNLYGRSHVAWQDIAFLTSQTAEKYGLTLEIRSNKKLLGIIPRGVCYSPKHADKTIEEVVAALRIHRHDLTWSGQ